MKDMPKVGEFVVLNNDEGWSGNDEDQKFFESGSKYAVAEVYVLKSPFLIESQFMQPEIVLLLSKDNDGDERALWFPLRLLMDRSDKNGLPHREATTNKRLMSE